jgi:zinc transporter 9
MAAVNANPSSTSNQHSTNNNSSQHNDDNYSHEGDSNESRTIHAHNTVPRTIGLAMVFGFGMMFLLEKLAHSISSHSRLFRMIGGGGDGMELEERSPGPTTPKPPNMSGEYSNGNTLAVLVGMIIHCAADGIALGAASSAKQSDLELLVFLAILLHKAPSAFGLTSYLLTAGMQSRRAIKHQLLVFSIAAPATAMISSILLDMIKLTSSSTCTVY